MKSVKLWYFAALVVLTTLSLAGCGGSTGSVAQTDKGYKVTVDGKLDTAAAKSAAKSAALSPYSTVAASTVYVIDAQAGTVLTSGAIASDGSFKGLSFTMPTAKSILVFKAVAASGTVRSIVPIDLSNPPASGIVAASNAITIGIDSKTDAIAKNVSLALGLSGILGDGGQTLASKSKVYADALALVTDNGGQSLAYSGGAFALTGKVNSALLPARDASTLTNDDLNNITLDGKIISAYVVNGKPIVNFQVTNKATGKGITGLATFSLHVAKLVPASNGTSNYWANYITPGIVLGTGASAITQPSTDPATSYNTDGSLKYQGYTVVDKGDGTYTATFGANITTNTNVAYDATLIHRIAVGIRSIAKPGITATGPINPATNAVNTNFAVPGLLGLTYDFTPSSGVIYANPNGGNSARDIVTIAACNQCHYKLGFSGGHFASRPDTKICVMCHTSQLRNGEGEYVTFIHRIHMGEKLNEGGTFTVPTAANKGINGGVTGQNALITYGEQRYPQDIRNCELCHQGVDSVKSTNHFAQVTRKNCASCHNALDFAAAKGSTGAHTGGIQADDSSCALCHKPGGLSDPAVTHLPVVAPDPKNSVSIYKGAPYNGVFSTYSAAYQANARTAPGGANSNTNASYVAAASLNRLPVGAKAVSFVVYSTSVDASKHPYMKFKFQTQTADSAGKLGAKTDVTFNDPAAKKEMMDGFVGSPSVYFAFAVPQDGIAKPVDFNATLSGYLKRIWNGTATAVGQATGAGTLAKVSGKSYYQVTLTGVTVPSDAVMLTGGLGYTYGVGNAFTRVGGVSMPFATTTQPLTQIDLTAYPYTPVVTDVVGIGGLSVPADNKWLVAKNFTGRRLITDTAKCNACHGRLGVNPTFHAGQRNDAQTCTFCHNVNKVNSGWGVNIKEAVHAIHAAGKRANKFSWEISAGDRYWNVTYPGYLRNCEQCHISGMYDYSNTAYTASNGAIFDSMLYTTTATGTMPSPINVITTGTEADGTYWSTFAAAKGAGYAFGSGFSFTANNTGSAAVTTAAAATTLVNSPITGACSACHDTKAALAHMSQNGGSHQQPRTAALATTEGCLACHGTAANTLNSTVPTIKQVHRWW